MNADNGFNSIISESVLGEYLDRVNTLCNEARIEVSEGGFETRGVDPANVGMVNLYLSTAAFESYDLADEPLTIGVDVDRLSKVVGLADSGRLIHFGFDPESRKLTVELATTDFTLALIDPDSIRSGEEIPDPDNPVTATFEARYLDQAIKAAEMVGDYVRVRASEEQQEVLIEAEGDTDDTTTTLGEDEHIELSIGEDVASTFSLDYLKDVSKPFNKADEIDVQFGDEYPVVIEFEFADSEGSGEYQIAPRVNA